MPHKRRQEGKCPVHAPNAAAPDASTHPLLVRTSLEVLLALLLALTLALCHARLALGPVVKQEPHNPHIIHAMLATAFVLRALTHTCSRGWCSLCHRRVATTPAVATHQAFWFFFFFCSLRFSACLSSLGLSFTFSPAKRRTAASHFSLLATWWRQQNDTVSELGEAAATTAARSTRTLSRSLRDNCSRRACFASACNKCKRDAAALDTC